MLLILSNLKIFRLSLLVIYILLTFTEISFSQNTTVYDLIRQIKDKRLYEDPMWMALLHYKRLVNGRYISEADGKEFFISKSGKYDPESEMIADISGFIEPEGIYDSEKMHPQCRFPARYKWLKAKIGTGQSIFKDIKCIRFEEWARLIRPKGMTLIFASGYLNNPASMFGHTFIRLDRKEKSIETDLLSYVINYAAIPTTSNALLYALLGLTGGFDGKFSTLPYYMKVKEYGSMEHRDLWEYHLNVNDEQLDYILRHIWELGSTYFNYFYIDENCSYHILSLIQIAYPEIDFRDFFSIYTVPQDTIKFILKQKNIIRGVTYRPSLKSLVENMIVSLDSKELETALKIARSEKKLELPQEFYRLSEDRRASVLDVASLLYRFYNGYGLPDEKEREVIRIEKEILLLRSRINIVSKKMEIKKPSSSPDKAHGPAMLLLGAGTGSKGSYELLEIKPVLHDLISLEDGYEPLTQIDMLKLSLRFGNRYEKFFIDGFDFIKIFSLAPLSKWVKKLSWKLSLGSEADYRKGVNIPEYLDFSIKGGPGIAFSSHIFKRETYFLFWQNEMKYDLKYDFGLTTGIFSGILINIAKISDMLISYNPCRNILYAEGLEKLSHNILLEGAVHITNSKDMRVKFKVIDFNYYEGLISLATFF